MDVQPLARMTIQVRLVLQGLLAAEGPVYGFALADEVGVPSESAYRCLHRLRDANWVSEHQEDSAEAFANNRPARVYYELTDQGRQQAEVTVGRQARRVTIEPAARGGMSL